MSLRQGECQQEGAAPTQLGRSRPGIFHDGRVAGQCSDVAEPLQAVPAVCGTVLGQEDQEFSRGGMPSRPDTHRPCWTEPRWPQREVEFHIYPVRGATPGPVMLPGSLGLRAGCRVAPVTQYSRGPVQVCGLHQEVQVAHATPVRAAVVALRQVEALEGERTDSCGAEIIKQSPLFHRQGERAPGIEGLAPAQVACGRLRQLIPGTPQAHGQQGNDAVSRRQGHKALCRAGVGYPMGFGRSAARLQGMAAS